MNNDLTWTEIFIGVSLVLLVSFSIVYVAAYLEANAYENVTGKKVSALDAIFIELRVCE